nr:D-amino acid dehydrogenase [Bradyrhizobium sp. DOA9]GAJ37776.1 D-amino acid dehydrogenase 2 small subunit [Bradyrhizobium sp. DOA9]
MRVCVLGAGVIGLTTAWELAQRGYEVAVVDRRREPAAETSFANGAQLSYAFVAPLASPETLRKIPGLLLSSAAPVRIRPTLDPDFIRWGLRFLAACNNRMVAETTRAQLALSALSRGALAELAQREALSFGLRTAGKIVLHRTRSSFDAARQQVARQATLQNAEGQQVLTASECLELEPALEIHPNEFAGAIYTPTEQIGDCRLFCQELAVRLQQQPNVTWQLGTHVRKLVMRANRVSGIETSQGVIETNLVVLTLGSAAARFAKFAGFGLPVYPMKGYSITARFASGAQALQHSVTDLNQKIVYAPLKEGYKDMVRVAGIADLVGFDSDIDHRRLTGMMRQAAKFLSLDLESDVRPWAGLRPSTPDSRPIIGWSPISNLFLNTGHGALGWTLACGSARQAAQMIAGEQPAVDPRWFALERRS